MDVACHSVYSFEGAASAYEFYSPPNVSLCISAITDSVYTHAYMYMQVCVLVNLLVHCVYMYIPFNLY